MDDEIFGVDLSMNEFFGGNVGAACASFTGSVFDFSFTGLATMTDGMSHIFAVSFIGVDDVMFVVFVRRWFA